MYEETSSVIVIYSLGLFGVLFGVYNIWSIYSVKPTPIQVEVKSEKESEKLLTSSEPIILTQKQVDDLEYVSGLISNGANIFLAWEYLCLLGFVIVLGLLIFFTAEHTLWTAYTTIAFVVGAGTSILCGFIGMKIATASNYRTAYKAHFGLGQAFGIAYQGGCVLGFVLVSVTILVLMTLILIYKSMLITTTSKLIDYSILYEAIAGFGLGGSSVALFCRVGGGIYTKAADVGADLVAKLEFGLEEDDPSNPACIADNVGDNVGDIAGMGSDLFGSLAESTCAALLIASTSSEIVTGGFIYYPIVLTASGIAICFLTTLLAFFTLDKINDYGKLELTIKLQIVVSSILLIPAFILISLYLLPNTYSIGEAKTITYRTNVTKLKTVICPITGLISGMIIGIITEYYTSMNYGPVKGLTAGCRQGPAINIILGLALGFLSTMIPTILIALTVFFSFKLAGLFGISLAAIGMLGNLPICLAIDGYGPISDNAGGLATMCELHEKIREVTDELDSAGNTTAAIGKGFAIGSACLVAFALFGAFVTRCKIDNVNLLSPIIFSGLLFGAMIPYLFSALTMEAVGKAAEEMVEAVRDDLQKSKDLPEGEKHKPDIGRCIQIATSSSLKLMILPGLIVILTPLVFGFLLGPKSVAGLLIGIIISGIQMATSSANSGGAWDNCKKSIKKNGVPVNDLEEIKYKLNELKDRKKKGIEVDEEELKNLEQEYEKLNNEEALLSEPSKYIRELRGSKMKIYKKTEKASIIGDTVGDPMKDTSGPSLNILIKLSSITSLVFALFFMKTSYLLK